MKKKSAKKQSSKFKISSWLSLKKHRREVLIISAFALFSMLFLIWFIGIHSTVRYITTFEITAGESVSGIANRLKSENLISDDIAFKALVNAGGGRVMTGVYDIPARASIAHVARMMTRGEVASTMIMIPEGFTVKQIILALDANPDLRGVACEGNCYTDGELFPDTYKVAKGTNRSAVMQLMRKKMQEIENNWIASGKIAPRPLKTWNEVVTLASIVQKETPRVVEMPMVASVFINRLHKGMRLQADPTVVYSVTDKLGHMQGKPLLTTHLQTDSPFNTYTRAGLPPHPIANVGKEAIRAVLKPADTNYYYFVADGTGGHIFSRTYDEHRVNHANWREIRKTRQ
ncbi:MAG: endolytic transglycosylase MltG [Alphaproteobacteria bacterium]|nr:endolytic transglycosylase MltG [Alphaproteobacteria bacterium]